jgi:hypothetical protein
MHICPLLAYRWVDTLSLYTFSVLFYYYTNSAGNIDCTYHLSLWKLFVIQKSVDPLVRVLTG